MWFKEKEIFLEFNLNHYHYLKIAMYIKALTAKSLLWFTDNDFEKF